MSAFDTRGQADVFNLHRLTAGTHSAAEIRPHTVSTTDGRLSLTRKMR